MKVGFLQFCPVFGDKRANLERVAAMMLGVSCDFFVLPELFSTGYTFAHRDELFALAEPLRDGETVARMATMAMSGKCLIAFGFAERDNQAVYNTCVLMGPEGVIGQYRKVHLFGREKEIFTPGNAGFSVYEYRGVKYGLMVCFDWIFPEACRTLALKGAQIIAHPSNLVLPYCPEAMVTRAIENRVFIITANRIGIEEHGGQRHRFIGRSQVVSPQAEILIRAAEEECCQVVEIDPLLALNKKVTPYNNIFDDRRPELYAC